jgi:3-oxoadipate enol-lactonase
MNQNAGQLSNERGTLAYEISGHGESVVFCHALATDRRIWESQAAALSPTFTALTYDLRGHGQSALAADGHYSFESMASDVVALMDHLGIERASVVGISVGGEIAQMMAAQYPDRIHKLLLASTACHTAEARAALWATRIAAAETGGMTPMAASSVPRWFSKAFRMRQPDLVAAWQQRIAATATEAYVGIARTIQSMDLRPLISALSCSTHIVCGSEDENTGPVVAAGLAALIPRATMDVIQGAGHFPNIEAPLEFTRWLLDRLSDAP